MVLKEALTKRHQARPTNASFVAEHIYRVYAAATTGLLRLLTRSTFHDRATCCGRASCYLLDLLYYKTADIFRIKRTALEGLPLFAARSWALQKSNQNPHGASAQSSWKLPRGT